MKACSLIPTHMGDDPLSLHNITALPLPPYKPGMPAADGGRDTEPLSLDSVRGGYYRTSAPYRISERQGTQPVPCTFRNTASRNT